MRATPSTEEEECNGTSGSFIAKSGPVRPSQTPPGNSRSQRQVPGTTGSAIPGARATAGIRGTRLALSVDLRRSPGRRSPYGRVEGPFDLDDIVLVKAIDLDDRAWRIRTLAPEFLLHLVHQRPEPEHVGDVDHEPDRVL